MSKYMTEVKETREFLKSFVKEPGRKVTDLPGRVAHFLAVEIERAEARLAEFKDRLDKNPMNAFEWADDAAMAAAFLHVYAGLGHGFIHVAKTKDEDKAVEHVSEISTRELLRLASSTSCSTGQVHNLVERFTLTAYSRLFDGVYGRILTLKGV